MIFERIKQEYQQVNNKINSIKSKIQRLPKGKLLCHRNGKYYRWRISDGHTETTLPKTNRPLAEKLAYKEYLQQELNNLIHEKKALSLYLDYHSNNVKSTDELLNLTPEFQNLISSYITPLSEELSTWASEPYERNTHHPEHLTHKTSFGYFVRSKSESLIATYLHLYKIPFRYECLLILGDISFYPDFTIRHPETGAYYYWDHFGLIERPSYAKDAFNKLAFYASHGLYPSINLITTFETQANPLNSEVIEKTIQHYFSL